MAQTNNKKDLDTEWLDEEWTELCHELEKARKAYAAAETAITAHCGTLPTKREETAETKAALQSSLEANQRKRDILREMRLFIESADSQDYRHPDDE